MTRLVTVALIASSLIVIAATPGKSEKTALDALRREIAAREQKVASLSGRAQSAAQQLEAISEELILREQEVELAEKLKGNLDAEQREVSSRIVVLEDEMARQKRYLAGRMVTLYKLGRLSYLRVMLSDGASSSSVGMLRYLVGRDARTLEEFKSTGKLLEKETSVLAAKREEAEQVAALVVERRSAVEQSRARQRQILARIEQEKRTEEAQLAELRDKAERLERLLSVLSGQENAGIAQASIREFTGALSWPVEGRLLERFGRERSRRFATFTINNGIRIAAEPGTRIRAVYSGTVLYAQWFKGYGNLIILDHGDRVFTLYGNTRGGTLKKGDRVQNAQVLALVSEDEDGDSGALYFEVRVDNKPVDPLSWLR